MLSLNIIDNLPEMKAVTCAALRERARKAVSKALIRDPLVILMGVGCGTFPIAFAYGIPFYFPSLRGPVGSYLVWPLAVSVAAMLLLIVNYTLRHRYRDYLRTYLRDRKTDSP